MRITDVLTNCSCGWSGTVGECEPDIDGDGGLGCPKCFNILNVLGPPKPRQEIKITFIKEHFPGGICFTQEGPNVVFVPVKGDSVHIREKGKTSFGWIVSDRRFTYDLVLNNIDITIWLKQEHNE